MALTEVVYEVAARDDPVCRFTRDHAGVRGVWRVEDADSDHGVFRSTLTLTGPRDDLLDLVKRMRASRRYEELEVVSLTPYAILLKLGEAVARFNGDTGWGRSNGDGDGEAPRAAAGARTHPVAAFLDVFGPDTILDPYFVEGGRLRVRAIVVRAMATRDALGRMQALRAAGDWERFRVIRVGEFSALKNADILRRVLTPEQEALLRLAVEMGYYESPRACTLEDIGDRVGLSVSPVHKKLKAAEQVLINATLDPSSVQYPERRRGRRSRLTARSVGGGEDGDRPLLAARARDGNAAWVEVGLRVRWPGLLPAAFTAERPGVRVVHHHLYDNPRRGEASSLLVVVGGPEEQAAFLAALDAVDGVLDRKVVLQDGEHASVRVRAAATSAPWDRAADPLARFLRRFGRGAFFHPTVMEGGDAWIRMVVTRQVRADDVVAQVDRVAAEAGWRAYDVVSVRAVSGDPAADAPSQSEELTARQEEVLRIAHAMGYYRTPRECTLADMAETLGISANAIHKNLTAAERKIIRNYLRPGAGG